MSQRQGGSCAIELHASWVIRIGKATWDVIIVIEPEMETGTSRHAHTSYLHTDIHCMDNTYIRTPNELLGEAVH